MRARRLIPLLAGALLLGAAAPAEIPDHPVKFIKVDDLKTMMDRGQKVVVVDVRSREEYEDVHIRGAKSVPIRALEQRARAELSKTVPVVFY